jgi:hypothetical protein
LFLVFRTPKYLKLTRKSSFKMEPCHSSLRYAKWGDVLSVSGLSCRGNYCPIRSLYCG